MWRSSPRRSKVSCLATLRHGGRDVTRPQLKAGFHGVTMKENHPTIKSMLQDGIVWSFTIGLHKGSCQTCPFNGVSAVLWAHFRYFTMEKEHCESWCVFRHVLCNSREPWENNIKKSRFQNALKSISEENSCSAMKTNQNPNIYVGSCGVFTDRDKSSQTLFFMTFSVKIMAPGIVPGLVNLSSQKMESFIP